MIKPPCKNCPDRVPGCHDHCDRFKEYRAEIDRAAEKHRAKQVIDDCINDGINRMMWAGSLLPNSQYKNTKRSNRDFYKKKR